MKAVLSEHEHHGFGEAPATPINIAGGEGEVLPRLSVPALCDLLRRYQFIHLPSDVYYISTLPVYLEAGTVLLVVTSSILICFLATVYPALQASRVDPADVADLAAGAGVRVFTIGIGKPQSKEHGADHVLTRFSKRDREEIDVTLERAADAVRTRSLQAAEVADMLQRLAEVMAKI